MMIMRKFGIVLLVLALSMSVSYGKRKKEVDTSVVVIGRVDSLVNFACQFVGTPYRSTKYSDRAFDCSGFTRFVFGEFGYKLGASSRDQIFDGEKVKRNELCRGDLVFFKGRDASSSRIGHVGIVTEVDSVGGGFRFVHSSNSGGIIIDNFPSVYYGKRYVGACRVIVGSGATRTEVAKSETADADTKVDVAQQPEALADESSSVDKSPVIHRVVKGDTLYAISKKYATTVAELMKINNLKSSNLQIGKELRVK